MDFISKIDNLSWQCTIVYGLNERSHKRAFWEELRNIRGVSSGPWVICGYFNAIFAVGDKMSGNPNLEDIRYANLLMQDWGCRSRPLWEEDLLGQMSRGADLGQITSVSSE